MKIYKAHKLKVLFGFIIILILILGLNIILLSIKHPQILKQQASATPQFSHVFVIIFENHSYSEIIGNSAAPYINSLANKYGVATNFLAIGHPSLPNYFAITGGSTYGVNNDCNTCFQNTTDNIFNNLEQAGKTWKSYAESMPSNCFLNDSGQYPLHHNPAAYYLPLRNSCAKNDVPYSQFASDLKNSNIGNFNFIVPNNIDNMHSGTIQAGDTWLSKELPQILSSSAFLNNGVIFFTFDEGNDKLTPNQVLTIVISPLAKLQFKSSISYNFYSLLKTVSDGLGIKAPGQSSSATPMIDFFNGNTGVTPTPTSSILTPTPTMQINGTKISIAIGLHGIANGGDNTNPNSPGNPSPKHTSRSINISIYDSQNTQISQTTGTITFDPSSGLFKGLTGIGTIKTGDYLFKFKTDGFLIKQIPTIIHITANQTNTIPQFYLINGDINNNNQLDIVDYTLLIDCFGTKQTSPNCKFPPAQLSSGSDIDDDGSVGGTDYNLFLREIAVQKGT